MTKEDILKMQNKTCHFTSRGGKKQFQRVLALRSQYIVCFVCYISAAYYIHMPVADPLT